MSKYLYGAAVQGIQSFIFQTNKLKEIVGASELVQMICTDFFNEMITDEKGTIQQAAGKILHIFEGDNAKEDCQKVVREFPYKVMSHAPGITISQAVVNMEQEQYKEFGSAVNELERRLKVQRNIPVDSVTLGLMGIERSRTTGLPVKYDKENPEDHIDYATWNKLYYTDENGKTKSRCTTKKLCLKAFGSDTKDKEIAYDIEQITKYNDWIAIIHADGNGMGQVVQKVGTDKDQFHTFSVKLDEATSQAAVNAYDEIKGLFGEKASVIPLRPIVLSGDDHTLICRGDLAIPYTKAFLNHFEKQTKEKVGHILQNKRVFSSGDTDHLTACAGIAFVKSSFPFYYGYNLAEALCSKAKKDAKDSSAIREGKSLPASCLMFYKVQDSFGDNLDKMIERELRPNINIGLDYGPYYLNPKDNRMTIQTLLDNAVKLGESKEGNAVKTSLRQWISLLFENNHIAAQRLSRINEIAPKAYKDVIKTATTATGRDYQSFNGRCTRYYYPAYDMLVINTINHLNTK